MPSPFTHALLGLAAAEALAGPRVSRWRLRILSVGCATVPDLDALGFAFGIRYGDLLGHRGLTHSLAFALLIGMSCAWVGFVGTGPRPRPWVTLAAYFSALAASHGLLDAMTNGGLGIAFLSPFEPARFFLPWRPIVVAPLSIAGLFTERGARMLVSELSIVGLPALLGLALVLGLRRVRQAKDRLTEAVATVASTEEDERRSPEADLVP